MAKYRIEDIEGVGPAYGEKLRRAGIKTVNGLLKRTCHRKGRQEVAAVTNLDESLILKWVNMADLYRVKGIGSEYAELLEKSGVDTVKELKNRNPEKLLEKMKEINVRGQASVRQMPGLRRVQSWIESAKELAPKITY